MSLCFIFWFVCEKSVTRAITLNIVFSGDDGNMHLVKIILNTSVVAFRKATNSDHKIITRMQRDL